MQAHRPSVGSRLCRLPVVVLGSVSLLGCSMTRTTVSVRSTAQAPTQQVRLIRPDAAPLTAAWRQEGRELVGQLAFTAACQSETRQVTRREQLTETRPNKTYYVAAYVAGALLSVAGVGMLAASQSKNDEVYCGSGGHPRAGDTCDSEAGAWRKVGVGVLSTGLVSILSGVLVQTRPPDVRAGWLPPEERVSIDPKVYACGHGEDLKDLVLAAELSGGGKWLGKSDEQGVVRIVLGPNADLASRQSARFLVESAPKRAESFAPSGLALGELELSAPRKLTKR
jgi:hypothetical protein